MGSINPTLDTYRHGALEQDIKPWAAAAEPTVNMRNSLKASEESKAAALV